MTDILGGEIMLSSASKTRIIFLNQPNKDFGLSRCMSVVLVVTACSAMLRSMESVQGWDLKVEGLF